MFSAAKGSWVSSCFRSKHFRQASALLDIFPQQATLEVQMRKTCMSIRKCEKKERVGTNKQA